MRKVVVFICAMIVLLSCRNVQAASDLAMKHYKAAIKFQRLGEIDNAIDAYKRALENEPEFANAFYELGRAYYIKAAMVNKTDPSDPFAMSGSPSSGDVGSWTQGLEDLDLAIENFLKVYAIQPNAADVCLMLGLAYHNKGDFEQSVQFHDRSIALDPSGLDGQDSRQDKALIYYLVMDKKEEAVNLLEENLKINPTHELSKLLVEVIEAGKS